MKLTTVAAYSSALFLSGAFAADKKYPTTATVNCREGPGTSFDSKKTYKEGDKVTMDCQAAGSTVEGNKIWDKTSDGCYVADYYVDTGSDGYVADKCKDVPEPPDDGAGPIEDDYPYPSDCGGVDEWNYYKCQCTSFVAWRINDRLGIDFNNQYKGYNWGNGNEWDDAADATGVPMDHEPVPGCVAQTDNTSSGYGHVAWVAEVDGDTVLVEEYNWDDPEGYGTRKVSKDDYNFIHIKN